MDRFEAMQLFVSVADLASFAAAARKHGLSPARVTRSIAALEQHVGTKLLHRTTRMVRLTEAGSGYLARCKQILAELEEAEASAGAADGSLHGRVSVTAPQLFGRLHVADVLLEFLRVHPRITLRVLFADRVVDLLEQNIDVAVRIAHLPDSDLRAVRVGAVRRVVVASPAYLRAHGVPRQPSDLATHALIAFSGLGEQRAWCFARAGRLENTLPRARLVVNSGDLALAAARAGQGLCNVLSYQVEEDVRQKRLRIVLAEHEPPPVPVHVVHREGKAGAARVRAFVELAVTRLRARLDRLGELAPRGSTRGALAAGS
ncbi:MAG: LysR family transcriptional regulator [Polyangiales bacterium]